MIPMENSTKAVKDLLVGIALEQKIVDELSELLVYDDELALVPGAFIDLLRVRTLRQDQVEYTVKRVLNLASDWLPAVQKALSGDVTQTLRAYEEIVNTMEGEEL